ncbi:MAG: glycosyltransferase family 2 protein [Clostridia bacterium]|nr:glycosyltransferase family 2 protein [Clostridia bacterium]
MKFSIIMPTYNSEKYVAQAIESVLSQTCGDFELIVVDDGSVDETYNICLRFAENDSRVSVIAAEHGGVSAARNLGLSKIQGKYVLFIDGDDTWGEELLSSVQDTVGEQDNLLVFGMQHDWYLSDDTFQYSHEHLGNSGETVALQTDTDIDALISSYNLASPCNKVYRADIIAKNKVRFCEKCVYLEDLKFNLDYLLYGQNIKLLKRDLYRYRLFFDKKQMYKRQFKGLFENADELYRSCAALSESKGWAFPMGSIFLPLLTRAYAIECLCQVYERDKRTQKDVVSSLNKNKRYAQLLRYANGKLYWLLRVCRAFRLWKIQLRMLKRRYDK